MATFNQKFAEAIKSGDFGNAAELFVKRTTTSKKNPINDFISSLNDSQGMARANQYEVEIIAPTNHPGGTDTRVINLHCSTITMPGHNLEQQTQRFASAPAIEIVQGHTYAGNITASFYLDASLDTKSWFQAWQELSFDPESHKAQYYNNYIGKLNIYQLGANGKRTYGIHCDGVYPATITPIEYSYESTDMLAVLSVEFAYRKWTEISDLESGVPYKSPNITTNEELLGTVTERLSGNGVLTRAEILRKFG